MKNKKFIDIASKMGVDISKVNETPTNIQQPKPQNTDSKQRDSSLEYISNRVSKISNTLNKLTNHRIPDADGMIALLQENEMMRREIRTLAANVYSPNDDYRFERIDAKIQSIEVSVPDGCYLKLDMYPLVNFPVKGGYNVYFEVKDAVTKFITENNIVFPQNERFTLVYQRVTTGELVLAKGRCDNDNIEMKRVTNAISEAIGIADSVDKFSFFYTTIQGTKDKTEVFLLPEINPFPR